MEVRRKFTLTGDILSHLVLAKEYIKINTKTFFEYKASSIIQIVTMFLNDVIWIIFWALFFMRFSIIKGWTFQDFALLYALAATSYGVVAVFFGARKDIPEIVFEGRLDYYLTLPKNVLFHLLISKTSWFGLGDLIFGIVCAIFLLNPSQYPIYLFFTITSTIILLSFEVTASSLTFYIGNSRKLTTALHNGIIAFSTYPLSIFDGLSKVLLMTIIPAAFITGVPVELMRHFDYGLFITLLAFMVISVIIAVSAFYYGLKKYESGNLLYVNS